MLSTALLIVGSTTGDGPSFLWWFVLMTSSNVFLSLVTPTGIAVALRPMGSIAGTAAGVIGACSMAGSALLAALVDARMSTTATPMTVAYLVYGAAALVAALWARPNKEQT